MLFYQSPIIKIKTREFIFSLLFLHIVICTSLCAASIKLKNISACLCFAFRSILLRKLSGILFFDLLDILFLFFIIFHCRFLIFEVQTHFQKQLRGVQKFCSSNHTVNLQELGQLFQKLLHHKQSYRLFLNCFFWKITDNKPFTEKVSVLLKMQFFVVCISISISKCQLQVLLMNYLHIMSPVTKTSFFCPQNMEVFNSKLEWVADVNQV